MSVEQKLIINPEWEHAQFVSILELKECEQKLETANDRIKRLEDALSTLVKMHRCFTGKVDGITHERSYYCFYKGQYENWKKAIEALEVKEAKP